ncbi:GNAT family N-acetyltransferase [Streptomyces hiroshimensis]|uniref:N-acetyltransferase domain-containing protein n=1 Tax=Streptomyces hiroshimensis TaxID=66424 RepID=A0ABQ2ZDJ3_9ACTN|nr:GNAT family N-acetyltransferase [Streptomyces hiroshimensis]GGY09822.1 hypothetical protein GCM10010324_65820 [Streptomyces hiroshimensis]
MGDVFLRRLSRWQADQYRDQLADLHVTAYAEPHGHGGPEHGGPEHRGPGRGRSGLGGSGSEPRVEPFHSRDRFRERLAEHSARPGFDLVVADAGGPVGCAYGYPLARDSARWQGFLGPVPGDLEELTAAGRVFAVAELVVAPRHRRQGIGRRLHDRLLSGSGAALAALVLAPGDAHTPAAEAVRRAWGWQRAGRVRPPAAGDVGDALEVFVRPLRR